MNWYREQLLGVKLSNIYWKLLLSGINPSRMKRVKLNQLRCVVNNYELGWYRGFTFLFI